MLIWAIPIYWVLVWAAFGSKKTHLLPLRFLEGYFLAEVCFHFLPQAFEGSVLLAGIGALLGIGLGAGIENALKRVFPMENLYSAVFFTCLLLPLGAFLQGLVGGLALYGAGSGIMPESKEEGKTRLISALGGGVGFLIGVLLYFS